MSRIVSVHSFRGGTGKSNTTANLAALLAARGLRVCIIDTDIASPGIHVLLGLQEQPVDRSLNDYLWGRCNIQQAVHDVTGNVELAGLSRRLMANASLGGDPAVAGPAGKIYLVASSVQPGEIARVLREGYDVGLLNDGFRELIDSLNLDVLLIDTHPGLNEETLLSIAISDVLIVVLRPDQQDYQGTGVTIAVARKLSVPEMLLVVNKVPAALNELEVKARIEQAYQAEVVAVLPHSDEMMLLASEGVFVARYPDHPITAILQKTALRLVE